MLGNHWVEGLASLEARMKKLFCTWIVSVILVATLITAGFAQSSAKEKEQKQRVKIVVVEKREKPGGDRKPQKPPEGRGNKRP